MEGKHKSSSVELRHRKEKRYPKRTGHAMKDRADQKTRKLGEKLN